ncbi:hypothetical protein [Streptomyces sp. SID8354]|uniref:hypothetical protein n=1 Tax=Streptomyces sp. SID8354 TaxID=2690339 RepID=UPI0003A0A4FD|nr:hypothetical protein [Streptomyces sp. SID8354]
MTGRLALPRRSLGAAETKAAETAKTAEAQTRVCASAHSRSTTAPGAGVLA